MRKVEMTLAYFVRDGRVLLPLKKRKMGEGKYNGVGGKLEKGETHEQAMVRECVEEIGLKPTEYEYMAELSFYQPIDGKKGIAVVYVYVCRNWTGELVETDEMKPYWFDINNIPYDKTMDDDKYWLPLVLDGKKIVADFYLDGDYVTLDYKIRKMP